VSKPVKIIDLFAGPGGLGEGFSAYRPEDKQVFKIAISIEKEDSAHRTLLLRSLFRQFDLNNVPDEYYAFLRGELGKHPEDQLYKIPKIKKHLKKAEQEAQKIELGVDSPKRVYKKIRDAIGNDECILIGGPPCQAYSLVGRSRNSGDKEYVAEKDPRNFLYREYLKIISKFQPQVFIMENVKGILSAEIDGHLIFNSIRKDLRNPFNSTMVKPDKGKSPKKYKIYSFVTQADNSDLLNNDEVRDPHDFIIRMEDYGLPQARHRVILLGIREDIANNLDTFKKLQTNKTKATVRDVISDLPELRSRLSKGKDSVETWREAITGIKKTTLKKIKSSEHVTKEFYKNFTSQIDRIKNSPEIIGADKGLQKKINYNKNLTPELKEWYKDDKLGNYVVNHEARGHINSDLHRYLYYSTYSDFFGTSPKSSNLPKALWPNHKNFSTGKFADRFRVQQANLQGTTITCHISKDGHYFIHYDPSQCRSLTVREAARIQTFPDNYYFVGTRTQQYVQVGNAVPPYLAAQIADIVYEIIK
jgi:DNA (cytosine-5)-methyltransferase 1